MIRLFGHKTQAETGFSDSEYAEAKRIYFEFKRRWFLIELCYVTLGMLVLCGGLFAVIGGLLWLQDGRVPWQKFAYMTLLAPLLIAMLIAGSNFLFGSPPLPPRRPPGASERSITSELGR